MIGKREIVTVSVLALAVGSLSAEALAVANRSSTATRQLATLMHKEINAVVSRDEFVQYMGTTYDRIDSGGQGQLTVAQLAPVTSSDWLKCESLAMQRGIVVNEREGHRQGENGPSPWKQFMDSCLAGKIR